jgi:DNA (cytosine-5)-methyltransferase 1
MGTLMTDAIDLCAGIGWAEACSQVGVTETGVDTMPEVIETRKAMGVTTIDKSIADLPDDFCSGVPIQIAGPPCQTFSLAGHGSGRWQLDEVLRRAEHFRITGDLIRGGVGDPRTWLVLEPLRLAMYGQPEYVVWEQVPSVLPVWDACGDIFTEAGYSAWSGLIHAEQYGVPQTRKRAFFIARKDGKTAAPPPVTHSRYHNRTPDKLDPGVLPWVSMNAVVNFDAVMRSNYGTTDQPAPTVTSKISRNKWYYRSSTMPGATCRQLDQPAPTVAFGNDMASVKWMPGGIRVTVSEACALQTFPNSDLIKGGQTARYTQVGNMVPPLLGAQILRGFL